MITIFALLIAFQIKHFLADYPLQGKYMLGKFKPGWDFVVPLGFHAGVHAWGTAIIIGFYNPEILISKFLPLVVFDFSAHFIMDRIKAGPRYLGRFKDVTKPAFWWCLGFDQMVHHLTHYFIIWKMVS